MTEFTEKEREMFAKGREQAAKKGVEVGGLLDYAERLDGILCWYEAEDGRGGMTSEHCELVKF